MADRYTSLMALRLDGPLDDLGAVVKAAVTAGDVDRHAAIGDGRDAQEVNWGGRMAKAVLRMVAADDGSHLLRAEAYAGGEGLVNGTTRQGQLLQGLARQLSGRVTGVVDLSAQADHDTAWLNRIAIGAVEQADVIVAKDVGEGTHWVHTHGAARFDVPDLELYGLSRGQVDGAVAALAHVHGQLLANGLSADLSLPGGEPIYLVPVLEAWQHLSLDWPGVGRAGADRGPGLDGPRATLSLRHKPRLGRYRKDFAGVLKTL